MVNDGSIEQYLKDIQIPLRLSCISTSGWPVVLSLWYLYGDGNLFCATPQSAKVVSYLKGESRCAFEVASDQPPYCGVRGRAVASIDDDLGTEILERLLVRYLGDTDNQLALQLLARKQPEVAIRLTPQSYYSWNFSDRMANLPVEAPLKICPD